MSQGGGHAFLRRTPEVVFWPPHACSHTYMCALTHKHTHNVFQAWGRRKIESTGDGGWRDGSERIQCPLLSSTGTCTHEYTPLPHHHVCTKLNIKYCLNQWELKMRNRDGVTAWNRKSCTEVGIEVVCLINFLSSRGTPRGE